MPFATSPFIRRSQRVLVAAFGFVLATLVSLAAPASAQVWNETGDAGPLPATAQATLGSGALTTITGTLPSATDVDMYCITVTDPANFYACLHCVLIQSPDLYLFDATGKGLAVAQICCGGCKQISRRLSERRHLLPRGGAVRIAGVRGTRLDLAVEHHARSRAGWSGRRESDHVVGRHAAVLHADQLSDQPVGRELLQRRDAEHVSVPGAASSSTTTRGRGPRLVFTLSRGSYSLPTTETFNLGAYHDTYADKLMKLIESRPGSRTKVASWPRGTSRHQPHGCSAQESRPGGTGHAPQVQTRRGHPSTQPDTKAPQDRLGTRYATDPLPPKAATSR